MVYDGKRKRRVLTLMVAFALFAQGCGQPRETADAPAVSVYVGNDLYARLPFGAPDSLTVEQDGRSNTITLTETAVYMSSATCDNQLCVHQGEITLENISKRLMGGFIVCTPNGVVVELAPGEAP